MYVEIVFVVGWIVVPLIAYAGGQLAVWRTERRPIRGRCQDAEQRLARLRSLRDSGHVIRRGRMADALRLAEGAGALMAPDARQP